MQVLYPCSLCFVGYITVYVCIKRICKQCFLKKTLNISYSEFRKRFARELQLAFKSYRQTQLNKYAYKIKDNDSIEQDFYFNLQWNFNHFGMSNWYIEKAN